MEHIYLQGSEDVRSAANIISSAAGDMKSAAYIIDDVLSTFVRNFTEQIDRLQNIHNEITGKG